MNRRVDPANKEVVLDIMNGMAEDTYRFLDIPTAQVRQTIYNFGQRFQPKRFTAVDYGTWTVLVCEPSPETKRLKYGTLSKEQGPGSGDKAVQG